MGTYVAIYQASKAALITAGEGWRLELAPLGVRVITLVTGGISTKFLKNLEPVQLSEDSYYICIKDMIEDEPDNVPMGMEPKKFALDVLRHVEKGSAGKVWIGGGAAIMRPAAWLSPQCLVVSRGVCESTPVTRSVLTMDCVGQDLNVAETICRKACERS